ncbi:unnamed protein product [Owenia fusiformis]|uniref:UMA domain-containing protein n=1 Tax=Owenia fusiformis TaxID=6347 RepID=A0A8S4P778_OWEFU|nr:unnamed protein product [Owenia fusiformis]
MTFNPLQKLKSLLSVEEEMGQIPDRMTSQPQRTTLPYSPNSDADREEDGFVLVGDTTIERSTVYPTSAPRSGHSINQPPSYMEYTRSLSQEQTNNCEVTADATMIQSAHLANSSNIQVPSRIQASNGTLVEQSEHCCSSVTDVPFVLSPVLCAGNTTNYYIAPLKTFQPVKYNYDFTLERSVVSS